MIEGKKAQVAMEYLILTAFILVAVAIIFSFSFVNYNQNIRIAQTAEALAKIANTVDDVYSRGEGNTRFIKVSFPDGMKDIEIVHKCVEWTPETPKQGKLAECGGIGGSYDNNVEFSTIVMEVALLGGDSVVMKETMAKIYEKLGEIAETNSEGYNKYSGSAYTIKVYWVNKDLVGLEKV